MNTDEINATITPILSESGVSLDVVLVGETRRNDWPCDEWCVTIRKDKKQEIFQYYTGTGLRAKATEKQKEQARRGFPGLTNNDKKGLTSYGKRYLAAVEVLRSPVVPTAASVLYSLLLDSGAVNSCFSDWCADFGYNDDSIKALETYNACCKIGQQLRGFFTHQQQETMREILQDY